MSRTPAAVAERQCLLVLCACLVLLLLLSSCTAAAPVAKATPTASGDRVERGGGVGACCDGMMMMTCNELTESQCAELATSYGEEGVFFGAGTTCDPGCWSLSEGACCGPLGECTTSYELGCEGSHTLSTFLGFGTTCAVEGLSCVATGGACCTADAECIDAISESVCVSVVAEGGHEGVYYGDGTSCTDAADTCLLGACCDFLGTCHDDVTAYTCNDTLGGTFHKEHSRCSFCDLMCAPLAAPTGACCASNVCMDTVAEADCADVHAGTFYGDHSVCADCKLNCEHDGSPEFMAVTDGACCVQGTFTWDSAICTDWQSSGDCAAAGGVFFGAGSTCQCQSSAAGECVSSNEPTTLPWTTTSTTTGACCRTDSRRGVTEYVCDTAIGSDDCSFTLHGYYLGDDTTCDSGVGPNGVCGGAGACCGEYDCTENTSFQYCRDLYFGLYLGNTTTCDECPGSTTITSVSEPTGACCLSDESCTANVTESYCTSTVFGTYTGDDSVCTDGRCGGIGACCSYNGCMEATADYCYYMQMGFFYGNQTQCNIVGLECNMPTGACCDSAYECHEEVTEYRCNTTHAGVFHGADSACADECVTHQCTDTVAPPYGACCTLLGSCVDDISDRECTGLYYGDGSTCECDVDSCLKRGAHCFSGVCVDADDADYWGTYSETYEEWERASDDPTTSVEHVFLGDGTYCCADFDLCMGACCTGLGEECVDYTSADECSALGVPGAGLWHGAGSKCSGVQCSYGACCTDYNTTCSIVPKASDCDNLQLYDLSWYNNELNDIGEYHGVGSTCESACPTPNPNIGACCLVDQMYMQDGCYEMLESHCLVEENGEFQGVGTQCADMLGECGTTWPETVNVCAAPSVDAGVDLMLITQPLSVVYGAADIVSGNGTDRVYYQVTDTMSSWFSTLDNPYLSVSLSGFTAGPSVTARIYDNCNIGTTYSEHVPLYAATDSVGFHSRVLNVHKVEELHIIIESSPPGSTLFEELSELQFVVENNYNTTGMSCIHAHNIESFPSLVVAVTPFGMGNFYTPSTALPRFNASSAVAYGILTDFPVPISVNVTGSDIDDIICTDTGEEYVFSVDGSLLDADSEWARAHITVIVDDGGDTTRPLPTCAVAVLSDEQEVCTPENERFSSLFNAARDCLGGRIVDVSSGTRDFSIDLHTHEFNATYLYITCDFGDPAENAVVPLFDVLFFESCSTVDIDAGDESATYVHAIGDAVGNATLFIDRGDMTSPGCTDLGFDVLLQYVGDAEYAADTAVSLSWPASTTTSDSDVRVLVHTRCPFDSSTECLGESLPSDAVTYVWLTDDVSFHLSITAINDVVAALPLMELVYEEGGCPAGDQPVARESGIRITTRLCDPCTAGSFSEGGYLQCQPCESGSFEPDERSSECDLCPAGTYNDREGQIECAACTGDGLSCEGEGNVRPLVLPGYWDDPDTDDFTALQCPIVEACPGALAGTAAPCGEGYSGYLCSECIADHYMLNFQCVQCPASKSLALGLTILAMVALTAVVLWKSSTLKPSTFDPVTLPVVLSTVQTSALFLSLDVRWPDAVQSVIDAINTSKLGLELAAPECYSEDFTYVHAWAINLSLSAAASVLLIVVGCIAFLMLRTVLQRASELLWAAAAAAVFAWSALYVSTSSAALMPFECTKQVRIDGTEFLSFDSDPTVECFVDSEHMTLVYISIAAVSVLAVGPIVVFAVMLSSRVQTRRRWLQRISRGMLLPYRIDSAKLQLSYLSIAQWEVVVMARKLALAFLLISSKSVPAYQALGAFIVFTVFLVAQCVVMPFRYRYLNVVEIVGLAALSAVAMMVFAVAVQHDPDEELEFAVAVLSVAVIFAVVALQSGPALLELIHWIFPQFDMRRLGVLADLVVREWNDDATGGGGSASDRERNMMSVDMELVALDDNDIDDVAVSTGSVVVLDGDE